MIPRVLILLLCTVAGLSACSGNLRSDDDQYRPLGDPHALQRGAPSASKGR